MTLTEWINSRNRKQAGMTAIHYAAFNGDLGLLKKLVELGANIK